MKIMIFKMPRLLPLCLRHTSLGCVAVTAAAKVTAAGRPSSETPETDAVDKNRLSGDEPDKQAHLGKTSRLNPPGPLWPHCILVITAAILCYVSSLHGDLVHDDVMAIRKNSDVTGRGSLWRLLLNDFWGNRMNNPVSHKSYRPLTVATFRLNHEFGGLDPWGYHVVNVVLHACASLLVTLTSGTVCDASWVAGLAGLLFAVHPIHTEAVAGLVGRADVLGCVLLLLTLHTYLRSCHAGRGCWLWLCLSLVLAALSLLSKEHAATVLPLCLIYDVTCHAPITFRRKGKWTSISVSCSCLVRWTLISVTGVLLLCMRMWIMGGTLPTFAPHDNPAAFIDNPFTRWLTHAYVYSINGWLLFSPVTLSYDWQMATIPLLTSCFDLRHLASLTCMLVLISLIWAAGISIWRKNTKGRALTLGLLLLLLPFLPASNLLFTVGFVVAERVLYIPSAGFCLLVALGVQHVVSLVPARRHHVLMAVYTLCLLQGVRTSVRNGVWRDRHALFTSGLQTFPQNAKMHYNYANWLRDVGSFPSAVYHYKQATRLWPLYWSAHNNLGTLLPDPLEAEYHYREALKSQPDHMSSLFNLALALSRQKRYDEGITALERIISLGGATSQVHTALGLLEQKVGHLDAAAVQFERALVPGATDPAPHNGLATIAANNGDHKKAWYHVKQALKLDPGDKKAQSMASKLPPLRKVS